MSTSYGPIEELHVCDNINEHMLGNVYCKFEDEEDAEKAIKGLSGRFFNNRPLAVEYSPVTDFREARYDYHIELNIDAVNTKMGNVRVVVTVTLCI